MTVRLYSFDLDDQHFWTQVLLHAEQMALDVEASALYRA
jgi:hypothetical protein